MSQFLGLLHHTVSNEVTHEASSSHRLSNVLNIPSSHWHLEYVGHLFFCCACLGWGRRAQVVFLCSSFYEKNERRSREETFRPTGLPQKRTLRKSRGGVAYVFLVHFAFSVFLGHHLNWEELLELMYQELIITSNVSTIKAALHLSSITIFD